MKTLVLLISLSLSTCVVCQMDMGEMQMGMIAPAAEDHHDDLHDYHENHGMMLPTEEDDHDAHENEGMMLVSEKDDHHDHDHEEEHMEGPEGEHHDEDHDELHDHDHEKDLHDHDHEKEHMEGPEDEHHDEDHDELHDHDHEKDHHDHDHEEEHMEGPEDEHHDEDHDEHHDHDHEDEHHDHDHEEKHMEGPEGEHHDEDHDEHHDHDHEEEHMEGPEGEHHDHDHDHEDEGVIPHCECVLSNANIDCADEDTLNIAMNTLLESADECLNNCGQLSTCSTAFWTLHVYHELCPNAGGAEAGELYHDFSLSCTECLVAVSEEVMMNRKCEVVDCSDIDLQNSLVAQLMNPPCITDCVSDISCQQAWKTLSAFHETCEEANLSEDLTNEFHEIEEVCPANCIAQASPEQMTPAQCAAELNELKLIEEQGATMWHTEEIPTLDVRATLDARGMPNALIEIVTEDLNLAPNVGQDHSNGEGYIQYYVNGEQVSRLYCPHAWVRSLEAGLNNITVTAHANDLSVFAHGAGILSGSTVVFVPEDVADAGMGMDMHMGMAMDNATDNMHMHGTKEWHSAILPTVNLSATPDTLSGYNFQVTVDGFEFAPESTSLGHDNGMGHVHYSIDGKIAGMVFCDVFHLDLPAGDHTINITLIANTHAVYVDQNGNPLSAELTLTF